MIDIKKIKKIEADLIQVGRELVSKAVMFKDDISNVRSIESALRSIEDIIKRETKTKKDKK